MGRQSSRIYFQGKDHKDIYFQGHYHDRMYIGSQLVWEKIKGGISWVGYENSGTYGFVKYNGTVFLYIDNNGNLYTSNDAVSWNVVSSPYAENYILHSPYLMEGNGKFLCGKKYRYYYKGYRTGYQLAVSNDGVNWEPINKINVIFSSDSIQEYSTDNTDGKSPYFTRVMYANGKYFTSSYGYTNTGIAYSSNLVDWYRFSIKINSYNVSSIEAVSYIDGYYYLGVSASTSSYVVKTQDFSAYETVFTGTSAKSIWNISKFLSGIIIHYQNDIYYSEDGSSFEKTGTALPESVPSTNDNIRANVFLNSNEYIMVNANSNYINEYADISGYKQILISDIFEYSSATSRISVILNDKRLYVFLNQETKVISLTGTMEG